MPRRSPGVVLVTVLGLAWAAQAQDVPPPVPAPAPSPQAQTQGDVSPDVARNLARLEALLPAFAAQARTTRLAVGGVFIATGLVAIPVGIVAEASWHQDYGIGLWVSGALLLGAGTLSLVWETPLETLNRDFQATAATLPPAQRLAYGTGALSSVAAGARTGRTVGAILDLVVAGVFYGIAIGELVSASNPGSDRTNLQAAAASSFVVGAVFTGAGAVQLVLPSPAETAYAVYTAGSGPDRRGVRVSGGVVPVRGGAMVGLGGSF
jgi:hypothetical protein